MKKVIIPLFIAMSLFAGSVVLEPISHVSAASKTTKTTKKTTKADKLKYYNKQLKKLDDQIEVLEHKKDKVAKSSEKYRTILKDQNKLLEKKKYYLELIMELEK
ncbi:hypothetical protein D3C78_520110 [compost metagenome]